MASKTTRYTPEFKRQMVDLARGGRSAGSLSKEFGPTAWFATESGTSKRSSGS